jgi:hypothetical protein
MHHIRKLEGVAYEEDGQVISDEVVVPLLPCTWK